MQKNILSDTKIVGIFGNPISHSLSPVMHNGWFKKHKLNYLYLAFNIFPQNLKSAVESIKSLNIVGVNVTVPYKVEVMKYLDKIDLDAKKIGSVNTIVSILSTRCYGVENIHTLVNLIVVNHALCHIGIIGKGGIVGNNLINKLATKFFYLCYTMLSNGANISALST